MLRANTEDVGIPHTSGTIRRWRISGRPRQNEALFSYHLVMGAGGLDTVGSPAFTAEDTVLYRAAGWWSDSTLSDAVQRNAEQSPDHTAYVDHPSTLLTWREFDHAASTLAEQLAGIGVARGDRVAVWHGDAAAIHVLFVAVERCGAVVVGIGARAGTREVAAIVRSSEPNILVSDQQHSGAAMQAAADVAAEFPVLILGHDAGALSLNNARSPGRWGSGPDLVPTTSS
jgi:acyl-CoA synthetase